MATVTNADRSRWARTALEAYAIEKEGQLYDDPGDLFVDLLCDLMHLADTLTVDFEVALDSAESHYRIEIEEGDEGGAS